MTQLYKLTECMQQIEDALEDGAPLNEAMEAMAQIEGEFKDKAIDCARYLMNLKSDIDQVKAEKDRLAEKERLLKARHDKFKDYLTSNMIAADLQKISNGVVTVTCGKPKPMLKLSDESAVPDEWKTPKVTIALDKKGMLDAIKAGQEIPGAELGQSKPSLSIK